MASDELTTNELTTHQLPKQYAPPGLLGRWLIRLLAAGAAGVAFYLLYLSLITEQLPPGCSMASGCADVLTSRWATIGPVPVSALAFVIYGAVLVASGLISPRFGTRGQRLGWSLLLWLSVVIVGAVAWFIALQVLRLNTICRWCMADHLLGILLVLTIWWQAPWGRAAKFAELPAAALWHRPRELTVILILGMLAAGWGIGVQVVLPARHPHIVRMPASDNDLDTGPGADRRIVMLEGELELKPHQLPIIGSADAPKLLVLFFDYSCPSCQQSHAMLLQAIDRYDGRLGVIALPMPLDVSCNPFVGNPDPHFRHSCELTRLALAVHLADPAAFAEFDQWLFRSTRPRAPEDARKKAAELLGEEKLEQALADPENEQLLRENVLRFETLKVDRLPVLMGPHFPALIGRAYTREQLFEMIEEELQLKQEEPN